MGTVEEMEALSIPTRKSPVLFLKFSLLVLGEDVLLLVQFTHGLADAGEFLCSVLISNNDC
jgi:hypothetical protein